MTGRQRLVVLPSLNIETAVFSGDIIMYTKRESLFNFMVLCYKDGILIEFSEIRLLLN